MDAHLPEWLWPIALFGGLGAFIDFLLGRAGQERTRSWLEAWWIRFDDVRWGNFGQKEALFAVAVLDRWCGRRFFSIRRWLFVFLAFLAGIFFGYLFMFYKTDKLVLPTIRTNDVPFLLMCLVSLAASASITRSLSLAVSRHMISPLRNLFLFVSLVIITYALFVFWPQIADFAKLSAGQAINTYVFQRGSSQYFWQAERFLWSYYAHIRLVDFYPAGLISAMELIFLTPAIRYSINLGPYPVYFAAEAVAYVSNGIRILLASIFCMSFIFQPALKRPLSLVWLRIVESDKPILTLVLGGVASLATAVSQIAKHV